MRKLIILVFLFFGIFGCQSYRNSQSVDLTSLSYVKSVQPSMKSYCIGCHTGSSPAAGLALTSYESVKSAVEKGEILHRINSVSSPMPPRGLMPKEVRLAIERWAKEGYRL